MRLLPHILNRIAFIRAESLHDGSYGTDAYLWHRDTFSPADIEATKKHLTVLVVCGRGVVTKPENSEIAARVKADRATFLWSTAGGDISFVRREQLSRLTEDLSAQGIVAVETFCTDANDDFAASANEFARQLYDGMRWKKLLRPTMENSAVMQALTRRIALPILGLFLSLLAANAVLYPNLNSRRQSLQTAVAERENAASSTASTNAIQQRLLSEFTTRPTVSRAMLCDRIASSMPEKITLTALDIEPIEKRFEAGKALQRQNNTAVIRGLARTAAEVSDFIAQLSQSGCCHDVHLTQIERERDGEHLNFRIDVQL